MRDNDGPDAREICNDGRQATSSGFDSDYTEGFRTVDGRENVEVRGTVGAREIRKWDGTNEVDAGGQAESVRLFDEGGLQFPAADNDELPSWVVDEGWERSQQNVEAFEVVIGVEAADKEDDSGVSINVMQGAEGVVAAGGEASRVDAEGHDHHFTFVESGTTAVFGRADENFTGAPED